MLRWKDTSSNVSYLPVGSGRHNDDDGVVTKYRNIVKGNRLLLIVSLGLIFGVLLTALNVWELHRMQREHMSMHASPEGRSGMESNGPVVWVHGKKVNSGYLDHVFIVFERLGFTRGTNESNWDVLWAHDYPFKELKETIMNLKHQKVNHFPASGYITNKVNLATSVFRHVPKAFKIPSQRDKLKTYAKENPNKMFVQKSNNHRGIKIKKIEDLDMSAEGSFIQEFIDKPLLVDGYKFDIGVYTVITSINPLRVYTYEGDYLFRFCNTVYEPFDADNKKKYVVGDDYRPIWKMESLMKYYSDQKFGMRESFKTYCKVKGLDCDKIWFAIKESIIEVILNKEESLIQAASKYPLSDNNFFELMRFDFVVDEDLNVYLMEANMSPNLSTSHFKENKLLYQQVLYNLLSVAGVARRVHSDTIQHKNDDEENMVVSDRDITVFSEICGSDECTEAGGCQKEKCSICHQCMNPKQRNILKAAYREHLDRHATQRLIPTHMHPEEGASIVDVPTLNSKNKWMFLWFHGKCKMHSSWC